MSNLVEYNQPSAAPAPKVQAVGTAGIAITAIVTLLSLTGVIVPNNVSDAAKTAIEATLIVASAAHTVITFVAGYFKKSTKPASVVSALQRTR